MAQQCNATLRRKPHIRTRFRGCTGQTLVAPTGSQPPNSGSGMARCQGRKWRGQRWPWTRQCVYLHYAPAMGQPYNCTLSLPDVRNGQKYVSSVFCNTDNKSNCTPPKKKYIKDTSNTLNSCSYWILSSPIWYRISFKGSRFVISETAAVHHARVMNFMLQRLNLIQHICGGGTEGCGGGGQTPRGTWGTVALARKTVQNFQQTDCHRTRSPYKLQTETFLKFPPHPTR
jgi:hypothetical protein